MHIFKYHPDNVVYINGNYSHSYESFKQNYPDFPIIEGQFFEYGESGLDLINNQGHHLPQDVNNFTDLIEAIGGLNGV